MNLPFLKTSPGDDPVICEANFQASPERLYRAWTDPQEIPAWFGQAPNSIVRADIDLREGGRWRFVFNEKEGEINALTGEYLDLSPHERIVFSWQHEHSNAHGELEISPVSQVTVAFAQSARGTRLTIRHEGVVSESTRRNIGNGWHASLVSLSELLGESALAS